MLVDDQQKALSFYTDVLGFVKKNDIPLGEHSWLTVVSPEEPDGVELVLEPSEHPAVKPFKEALVADGIPWAHVDIAGPSFNEKGADGAIPKGGTGYGVATLVRLIESRTS